MLRWLIKTLLALVALAVLGTAWALWRFATYSAPDPMVQADPAALAYFVNDYAPAREAFVRKGDALCPSASEKNAILLSTAIVPSMPNSGVSRTIAISAFFIKV